MSMRLKKLIARNVYRWDELEVDFGDVTEIGGENDTGKTSVLKILRFILGGGTRAEMLKHGAERGEAVLILDDDGDEVELTKPVTGAGDTVRVKDPRRDVGGHQSYLNERLDALCLNPIDLINARPKDRGKMLLEAAPLKVDKASLAEIAGRRVEIDFDPEELHGLEAIQRVRDAMFEERTGINRAAKEKRHTIKQLRGSLPSDVADLIPAELRERKRETIETREALESEYHEKKLANGEALHSTIEAINAASTKRIDALKQQIREIEAEAEAGRAAAKHEATKGDSELAHEYGPRVADLKTEAARIDDKIEAAAKHANTRKILDDMDRSASALEDSGADLTERMTRLDVLRTELLEDFPLPVDVRADGEIYAEDGTPFSEVNEAKQIEWAMKLGVIRTGDLKFVLVDGINALDSKNRRRVYDWAREEGVQLIVTERTDAKELTVTQVGEPALF